MRLYLVCPFKKSRPGPMQEFERNIEESNRPMAVLHANCLGPLVETNEGWKHVLVILDTFSGYYVLQPLKTVQTD